MNQYKIFASLGEMQSSSNLSYLSLTSLDYSMYDASPIRLVHGGAPWPMDAHSVRSGGQARVLISKSLTSTSWVHPRSVLLVVLSTSLMAACGIDRLLQPVRYFATKHLRLLYRSGVASFSAWGIQLLNKQVPHPNLGSGSNSSSLATIVSLELLCCVLSTRQAGR
jgi:hypothetical protein